jgi:hypothetical protein
MYAWIINMKKLILLFLILFPCHELLAQGTTYKAGQILTVGSVTPNNCTIPDIFILNGGTPVIKVCTATDTWTTLGWSGSSSVPQGAMIFVASGTCPATYTEVSALNGKMLRGTVAANGDVGQSAGSDSITPTTNTLTAAAQIFTGNSITSSAVTGGTPSGTIAIGTFVNVATATTGNCAATNVAIGTGATNACKATAPNLTVPAEGHSGTLSFTGSALATHTHTTTATGTNGTSSVTGTLNSFDNRPAYTNVIFCSKN